MVDGVEIYHVYCRLVVDAIDADVVWLRGGWAQWMRPSDALPEAALVARADVFLTNFREDAMRRLEVEQPYTRHLLESSIQSIR